ncbi:bacterioferritin [Amphritea balenae]|uniref:Bacterioferritin n=1 Tax=Amphritea balenae TaxID=452629 RepID=A0A3P1SWL7_9GAMM|nr:bacterioferritin [Amphritea balenae]RRD01622.1 bacterioferritin [Amphritea balenae]GGK55508.1 bacterioferritin [Amphritea balenae]
MKEDKKVLSYLNQVLTVELTSINQYFLHARMFRNWGLEALNESAYKKSIKDMKQADELIERILFLEGLPNLQNLGRLRIGEHAEEMMQCDMEMQLEQLSLLKEAIAFCETAQDYVSRELLEAILKYEEDYVDWIETQQYLITNTGIENYLQSQM